jgi:hypothetical protein
MSMDGKLLTLTKDELDLCIASYETLVRMTRNGRALHIGKSWAGIHYLLTHRPKELDLQDAVIHGRGSFGDLTDASPEKQIAELEKWMDSEFGYGPPGFLLPSEVAAVAKWIDGISDEDFLSSFNGDQMNADGVYPENWEVEALKIELVGNWQTLKSHYREAANDGRAMLLWVS